ncbi:MAG: hypothetical protein RLZZ148_2579 [Cyanobacteriota bacterium]|jgi:rSAM/selenodomain-associated transferase 2
MIKISIIIPVFNEAKILGKSLENLGSDGDIEVIVVDGGSTDKTVRLAQKSPVKVVVSPRPGRAYQMNLGAQMAQGEVLLFLHADTQLPPDYPQLILTSLSDNRAIAGAFCLTIASQERIFRLVEMGVNWRSRFLSLPYGDQAIFLKAKTFQEMGGYNNLPIMEDFDLIQRLKKLGKISIISTPVLTSARRWQRLGIFKTTLINQMIILGYWLGISPARLARWYGRK